MIAKRLLTEFLKLDHAEQAEHLAVLQTFHKRGAATAAAPKVRRKRRSKKDPAPEGEE